MAVLPVERPAPLSQQAGHGSDDPRRLRAALELEALAPSVPAARHFVTATLCGWRVTEIADDATLVVTEIVTNAYQALIEAARGTAPPVITLRLSLAGAALAVEVEDQIEALPERSDAGEYDEDGRGLLLVEAIATRWGCRRTDRHPGKIVWAELPLPT